MTDTTKAQAWRDGVEAAAKEADKYVDPEWPGDDLSRQAKSIAADIRALIPSDSAPSTAEEARLREALEPFAKAASDPYGDYDPRTSIDQHGVIKVQHLRRARALCKGNGDG